MPIRFRCSVCHNPLSIARRKVGTAINCARCSAALTVPAASDSSLAALRPRGSQHQTPAIAPAVVSPPTAPQEDAAFSALPSPDPLALPTKPLPAPSDGARRRWAVALAACGLGALLVAGLLLTGSARRQEVVAVQISRVTTPADPLLIAELGDPTRLGTPANNNQLIEPALTEGAKPKVPPVVEQPKEQPPPAVVPPPPVKKFSPRELAEAEAELYRTALKTAQQALIDGQFEQAVTWFQIAGKIRNSDEVVQGLLRAEQGRLEALVRAERERDRLEKERRLAKYGQWMLSGQSARHLRQFDDARTAYTEAQKLFPEDVRAADALTETERERLLWEADLKRKAERKKRQDDLTLEAKAQRDSADYRKAMAFGWSALRDGKFDAALASFGEALSLQPDDEDAKTGRDTAYWSRKRQRLDEQEREEKQWRQQLEARAREEQLRRDKAYKQFLFDGEEALGGRRHDEAVGLFLQALEMRPDDPEVLKLLREAQQAREKIRTEREEQAKVRLEQQALIASAAAKKLERLQQEQATLKQAEKARQRAAEARQFLIDSEVALASGQFDDALKLLDKARGLQPETPTMIALREQASQRKEERVTTLRQLKEVRDAQAKIKEETERRKLKERETLLAAQAAKQAKEFQAMSYERFLKEGKQALDQRAFDFAIAQLNAALRVRPEDAAVVELLDKAGRQREEHLQALAMEKEKHDREVAAAAEEARLRKQERDRLEGERQAQAEANRKARQFDQYLLDGRQSLGKNDPDVALTQLSLAQKLRPDDRDLKNLIEQAKQRKEKLRAEEAEEAKLQDRERARQKELLRLAQEKRDLDGRQRAAKELAQRKAEDLQNALKNGNEALAQGKPLIAIAAFNQALALHPGHVQAEAGLRQAQQLNEQQLADARKKTEQQAEDWRRRQEEAQAKQRDEEYERFMVYGRKALHEKQFDSAIGAFTEAGKRHPGDAGAEAGLSKARELLAARAKEQTAAAEQWLQERQAAEAAQQKALAEAKARVPVPRPKTEPIDQLGPLLATGRAAVELRRLDAAATALAAAKQLAPDNPAVARLEQDLELARKIVQADRETAEKLALQESLQAFPLAASERQAVRKAKIALHLEAGQRHLQEGRRAEAAREFEAILRLVPDQPEAVIGLKKAREGGEQANGRKA